MSQDAYDIARLVDKMEHLHFYQRAVVPRDIPEASAMDINTCYLSVSGTTKHVGTSWVHPDHLEASLKMLHEIAGGEDKWRARPFVSQSNCFVVPPLMLASVLKLQCTVACRCCCCRLVRLVQLHPLQLLARLCNKLQSAWQVLHTSTRSSLVTQQSLVCGASFLTCARVQCQVEAQSKCCSRRPARRWHISTTSPVELRRVLAIQNFLTHNLVLKRESTMHLSATPA